MADPKRRGRPPLEEGESSSTISVRVPSRVYDETYKKASQERVTVAALVRQAITHLLIDPPPSAQGPTPSTFRTRK